MTVLLMTANYLLPLLYLALLIDYGAAFFLRNRSRGRNFALAAVIALHIVYLHLLGYQAGRLPLSSYEILSVLAVANAVVYCVVEYIVKDRRTGGFVLLAVFLLQYSASVLMPSGLFLPGQALMQSPWQKVHLLPAILAYTAFTISAIYGMLHLLAVRDLKQRRFGVLFDRLPPLELLGTMNWHAMLGGFVFVSLAIVTGAIMYLHSRSIGDMEARTFIRIIAGAMAWLIYAGAVGGKLLGRWPALRVAKVSVAGFVVVMIMLIAGMFLSQW